MPEVFCDSTSLLKPDRILMPKPRFPAHYTPAVIDLMLPRLEGIRGTWVDPCAGVGLSLPRFVGKGHRVVGIEIEQPNVDAGFPTTSGLIEQGDSTQLHHRFRRGTVAAFFTSLAYGNRFADKHKAQERCSACRKASGPPGRIGRAKCAKCDGTGRRNHSRRGYTHDIRALTGDPDYQLHPNNAGGEHFGPRFQEIHTEILTSCLDVARPGAPLLLNVSDFIRDDEIVHVVTWHLITAQAVGWLWEDADPIPNTPRMRFGANREARVDREWLLCFRKPQ